MASFALLEPLQMTSLATIFRRSSLGAEGQRRRPFACGSSYSSKYLSLQPNKQRRSRATGWTDTIVRTRVLSFHHTHNVTVDMSQASADTHACQSPCKALGKHMCFPIPTINVLIIGNYCVTREE
jgi:hypothetical protein